MERKIVTVRSWLQILLKVVNGVMGVAGISMIVYGFWMVHLWQKDATSLYSTSPWFVYSFLGLGSLVCFITCIGYLAADSANGCCLSFYMMIVFLLLVTETAVVANLLLNSDWEKDLPEDPSGRISDIEDFVTSNFDTCKWIGFNIALAQGLSILLSMTLRSIRADVRPNWESEDEKFSSDDEANAPLLGHSPPPPYLLHLCNRGEPHYFASDNIFRQQKATSPC